MSEAAAFPKVRLEIRDAGWGELKIPLIGSFSVELDNGSTVPLDFHNVITISVNGNFFVRKEMFMGHTDTYAYPTVDQATAAAPIAYQIITGQADELTVNDKVKTLHTVGSFALGMVFPHEHHAQELSEEALAAFAPLNQKATGGNTGPATIDWKSIAKMVIAFILTLLG